MLDAILFDWGDTLMRWAPEPDMLELGHAAGLRAVGRAVVPGLTERFRDAYLPFFWKPGTLEELEYPALARQLLGEFGIELDDDELERYLDAEHVAWQAAVQLAATTHALLETLRERGVKLALVSNAFDPPALLHRDLERLGLAQRLDFAVFSSEVGWRKPHPAIFERALEAVGAEPTRALFVGDQRATDIAGAAALGMRTCQALWFRADESRDEPVPDFRAFTQMDVLMIVRRLSP
jgi:putative hydrolase of the HAD superfamily